jgi:SSS family solute:Na+ symporter
MNQMGYTLLLTMLIIVSASFWQLKSANDAKGITLSNGLFKTSQGFNIGAYAVLIILTVLYAVFW